MFSSSSNKVGTQDRNSAPKSRLRLLKHRTIQLGAVSFVSYPVLAGVSWMVNVITGKGRGWLLSPDPLTTVGTYTFAVGMTVVVALSFLYVILRRWSDTHTRSGAQTARLAIVGLITTLFSFAAFAILINLVDAFLHTGIR